MNEDITWGSLKAWAAANQVPDDAIVMDLDGLVLRDLEKDDENPPTTALVLTFGEVG